MASFRSVGLGLSLSFVAVLAGCGEKSTGVVPVTGIVMLDGKPLDLVHVEFWPDHGPRSFGKTDSEGRFALVTDDRTGTGAVPGTHKVALRDTWPMQDDYIGDGGDWVDMSQGRKSRIHTRYYDAVQSPLTVRVEAGQENHFEFTPDPSQRK
jgi:hypothetical protein